jgi:hypothetical protein
MARGHKWGHYCGEGTEAGPGGDLTVGEVLKFTSDDGDVVLVKTTDVSDRPLTRGGRPESTVIEAGQSLELVAGRIGPIARAGGEATLRIALRWGESRSR